jgi:hypothetical protein
MFDLHTWLNSPLCLWSIWVFRWGPSYKAKSIWDGIIEKREHSLASWKMLYLSKGGRLRVIKNTISNLPTYYLSLFPIPVGVANRIEKLQRDFLGVDSMTSLNSIKSIGLRFVLLISLGGLGVRNLILFNQALLRKWLWRFATGREALWILVVEVKYDRMWGGWCSNEFVRFFGVEVWKNIRRGHGVSLDLSDIRWQPKSSASKFSPFELATGQQPLTPHTMATGGGFPISLLCQEMARAQRPNPNLLKQPKGLT